MGARSQNYCDGCGDNIGNASLRECIQVTAIGTNGMPQVMYLCTKPQGEFIPPQAPGEFPTMPRITGCAKKVLTISILPTLYAEVREYVDDDKAKPFAI